MFPSLTGPFCRDTLCSFAAKAASHAQTALLTSCVALGASRLYEILPASSPYTIAYAIVAFGAIALGTKSLSQIAYTKYMCDRKVQIAQTIIQNSQGKEIVLCLHAKSDWNGAFRLQAPDRPNLLDFHAFRNTENLKSLARRHRVLFYIVGSRYEFRNALRKAAQIAEKSGFLIKGLAFSGHGNGQGGITLDDSFFNFGRMLTSRDLEQLNLSLEWIVLDSCGAGAPSGIGEAFAKVAPMASVYASPKNVYITAITYNEDSEEVEIRFFDESIQQKTRRMSMDQGVVVDLTPFPTPH